MDPFSAAASALGVADVCFRVGKSINNYIKKFSHIDELLLSLRADIESLATVCTAIKEVYDHASQPISVPTPPQSPQSPALSEGFGRSTTLAAEPDFASQGRGHERVAQTPSPSRPPKPAAIPVGGFPPSLVNLNDIIKTDLNNCKKLVGEMEELVEAIVVSAEEYELSRKHLSTESSGENDKAAENEKSAAAKTKKSSKFTKLRSQKTKVSLYTNIEHEIERKKVQISAYKQEMTIMLQIINLYVFQSRFLPSGFS